MIIKVNFFGTPEIFLDNVRASIPPKKLLALLLYLLYHTQCDRNDLTGIFWGGLGEENARQNLRNGLYRLKKLLGAEIFQADHQNVFLRWDVELIRDTDILSAVDAGPRLLKLPNVVFLDKLYLRDTPEFDKWVLSMRAAHEKIIIERLESNMREHLRIGGPICEDYAKKLLSISPYHEEAARVLIQRCTNRGQYSEAIDIYSKLARMLQEDLGILPENTTRQAYQRCLELRNVHKLNHKDWVVSQLHGKTIDELRREFHRFLSGQEYCHYILQGAIGAGKSVILQDFVQGLKGCPLIRVRFEAVNADIPFYAIGKILPLLGDLCDLPATEPAYHDFETLKLYYVISMDKLVSRLKAQRTRSLLLIENMEAIDRRSMDLVFSYLLDKCRGEIMVIGEYCTSFQVNRQALLRLELLDNVRLCRLPSLEQQEAVAYIAKQLTGCGIQDLDYSSVWAHTGGNLMLIDDAISGIRAGKKDWYLPSVATMKKFTVLLSGLSPEEHGCLELLSVFRYGAELKTLAGMVGRSIVELSDIVERLCQRELVTEERFETHLLAKVSPETVRQAVYGQISNLRRVELHRAAAEFYQQNSGGCRNYYEVRELKYHFAMTGQSYEQVYYALEDLSYRLDYCDDFFPTLQSDPEILITFYLSKSDTYQEFEHFENMLGQLGNQLPADQMCELNMTYQYLKGRTLIRDSRSQEGLTCIRQVISWARQLGREDMLLKGYLEMIFSALRAENEETMREYIRLARSLPDFSQYGKEQGILLRLEAMCDILIQNYEHARTLLEQSIDILKNPRLRSQSGINIAAACDYLGVIDREQGNYAGSRQWLEKAIDLCVQNNIRKSLDLFYTDLGYTLFLQGDYESAKVNFSRGAEIYNQFETFWLRSIGESCMAMIYADEGRHELALEAFRRGEIYSRKDHTKKEKQLLEQARSKLQAAHIL